MPLKREAVSMAESIASSTRSMPHDERWKWPLVAAAIVFLVWSLIADLTYFGLGKKSWWGYWGMITYPTSTPFVDEIEPPQPGLPADRAGIKGGDLIDLREQSFEARVGLYAQPVAHRAIDLIIHRGDTRMTAVVTPTTVWEVPSPVGILSNVVSTVGTLWYIGCAFLIILRRAWLVEGRILALALLSIVGPAPLVALDPRATLATIVLSNILFSLPGFLVVLLAGRFGVRSAWRQAIEALTIAAIAVALIAALIGLFGTVTLAVDPTPFSAGSFGGGWSVLEVAGWVVPICILAVAVSAVASTPRSERPRTAWLLLPLPSTFVLAALGGIPANFDAPWIVNAGTGIIIGAIYLLGGLAITYALLKRRVLDFEFVLSRTLVVAIVSLIIVAAFVLLEWALGTVLAGVSHTTGFVANAALALVLGISLNFIHKRVDALVDFLLFRKRHQDERALLDYSKEAAFVTDPNALLDQAIEKIREHTDARDAAILVGSSGDFAAARSFGDGALPAVDGNDPAILALKAWHKPLDPHRYQTALRGDLALPMLARGRLAGVIALGQRAGGESYAPDEVEALSQFAQGVGTALDVLSENEADALATLRDGIVSAMTSMQEAILSELRAQPKPAS